MSQVYNNNHSRKNPILWCLNINLWWYNITIMMLYFVRYVLHVRMKFWWCSVMAWSHCLEVSVTVAQCINKCYIDLEQWVIRRGPWPSVAYSKLTKSNRIYLKTHKIEERHSFGYPALLSKTPSRIAKQRVPKLNANTYIA